jgi:hypothetical protein
VREDTDEGLADRLALALLGDVSKDQDRLATRSPSVVRSATG